MQNQAWIFPLAFLLSIAACNLDQEIDIDLPDYRPQPVVECYLEPGQPFSLLLTQSAAYFDPFPESNIDFLQSILLDSAEVRIRYGEEMVTLDNQLSFNPFTRRLTNYVAARAVPALPAGAEFSLEVLLPDGRIISGATRVLPVVPIDSVVVEYAENDTLARVLTYFSDIPETPNFYRRMLHESAIDSLPEQDFTVDDRFIDSLFVFGSGYNYAAGDTLINTLYHIEPAYYDFLESLNNAISSNGNPFAQPSPIISTNLDISGEGEVIGIFTGLHFARATTVVPPR